MKLAGLAFADFAFPHLVIDAPILILQTIVDLGASRVILLPLRLGHCVSATAFATVMPVNAMLNAMAAAFAARLLGCPFLDQSCCHPRENARFEALNRH